MISFNGFPLFPEKLSVSQVNIISDYSYSLLLQKFILSEIVIVNRRTFTEFRFLLVSIFAMIEKSVPKNSNALIQIKL